MSMKAIVAELDDMRYTAAEIAIVLRISERRVGQILQDVKPRPVRLRSIDDLPRHMQERIRIVIDDHENIHILKLG